jgi:hypothetical protein
LDDQELTQLLHLQRLAPQHGFGFVSFSDRFVTLSVPPQRLRDWYPENGWISPEKEILARQIATRHDFSFCEPVDYLPGLAQTDVENIRHHIEFGSAQETIVVAHPFYLKVRLFSLEVTMLHIRDFERPLELHPDLLADLALLFQARRLDSAPESSGPTVAPRDEPSRHAYLQASYTFEPPNRVHP